MGEMRITVTDGTTVVIQVEPAAPATQPISSQEKRDAEVRTLQKVTEVLNGWVVGAKENHEASDHRGHSKGEECWNQFTPGDFRNMLDDAARELGHYGLTP